MGHRWDYCAPMETFAPEEIERLNLYTVRTEDGRTHDMILCECCEPSTAEYYRMIGWTFWRVRQATANESLNHTCLD